MGSLGCMSWLPMFKIVQSFKEASRLHKNCAVLVDVGMPNRHKLEPGGSETARVSMEKKSGKREEMPESLTPLQQMSH